MRRNRKVESEKNLKMRKRKEKGGRKKTKRMCEASEKMTQVHFARYRCGAQDV